MIRARRLARLLLAAAVAAGGGLAATAARAADINVCMWGTINGPDALVNGMTYGFRDYLEYLNQSAGGIAGHPVRTVMLDGRYKLDEELKIYRRCVGEENAVLIGGWSTGAAKALREQINTDRVPYIADSHSSEVVDPVKLPFEFTAGPTYEQQMIIALRDLKARGGKTVIFMHADNEYGRAPVNVIRQSGIIEKMGLELADTIECRYDAQDVTPQMLRAKAKNPDLIYSPSSAPQVIVALRDAAKVGLPPTLFVGNIYAISPSIPAQLGAGAEGFRAIQGFARFGDDIPAMKEITAFGEKNKIEKRDMYYMKGWLKGHATAAAITAAIAKNGGQVPADLAAFRQSVRDQLEGLKGFDVGGIAPPLDYADHQGSQRARIAVIKGGEYIPGGEWIDAR
jgi:branched-chain amino acid transport system substrate-binding protein